MKTKDNIGCVVYVIMAIIMLAISLGLTYLIGTSDLPNWLKFWLLM